MTLYATLELFKSSLKITEADRDELLTQALTAASRWIDRHTGRRPNGFTLDSSASTRTFDARQAVRRADRYLLLVDEIGSLTDLAVETGDGTTWTAYTDYRTEPTNALGASRPITSLSGIGWWSGSDQVRVTARWGWPSVPDEITQATLVQAGRLYRRKDSPEGVAGAGDFGVVRLARIDPDVRALLDPFVLPGFA